MIPLFSDFHAKALGIKRLNYGIITLIPKSKEVVKIRQYRPICLLNCIYKWFTKTLTGWSKWLIGLYILALHEILHETKRKGKFGVVLKLDFEKAYDEVHWGFLVRCLHARCFNETCCDWVKSVLNNGTVVVKLNDCVGPYF
jgi:hypothetical protein